VVLTDFENAMVPLAELKGKIIVHHMTELELTRKKGFSKNFIASHQLIKWLRRTTSPIATATIGVAVKIKPTPGPAQLALE
jgi:hypothetical protein